MNSPEKFDNSLPVGTVLNGNAGGYRITDVLARGSYGITYKAAFIVHGNLGETTLEAVFAIKECFIGKVNGRDGLEVTGTDAPLFRKALGRFREESKMLSEIHTPGVIPVIDAFEANSTAYYVMEYIDGGTLDSAIATARDGRLAEQWALTLIRQAGEAIEHIHSRGMAHLDIKPGNIMLRPRGSATVIDFGISRCFGPDGRPEADDDDEIGRGTEGYAPPEQIDVHLDRPLLPPMDVYALGATLYKMLTGQRPPKASEVAKEGFPAGALKACGVSGRTIKAITRAMSPAVETRFASVAAFLSALPEPANDEAVIISVDGKSGGRNDNRPPRQPERGDRRDGRNRDKGRKKEHESRKTPQSEKPKWPRILWIIAAVFAGILLFGAARQCVPSRYTGIIGTTRNDAYGHASPAPFDLCTMRSGEIRYFSPSEWDSVPATAKPLYQARGIYVRNNGRPFIVALDEENHPATWQQASDRHLDNIPTLEQAQAILSNAYELESAFRAFGGRRMEGAYWAQPRSKAKFLSRDNILMFYTGNWSASSRFKVRLVYPAGG